jgi:hypothetical protein
MKKLTLWLMKYNLKQAIKKQELEENTIIKAAYNNLIKNYKDTIMFLDAEIKSEVRNNWC